MEAGFRVGGVLGLLNTVVKVRMDEFLSERLQAFAGGDDLHEDFRTIAVGIEHSLNGGELSGHFAGSEDKGLAFGGGMGVVAHARM